MALDLQTGLPNLPQVPNKENMQKWAEDLTRTLHGALTTIYTDLLNIKNTSFVEESNIVPGAVTNDVVADDIVAASITGQGALATANSVSLSTQVTDKSLANLDSTANTKLSGIEEGADVTADNVAASITGQGALATADSVDLATGEVTNKSLANLDSTAATALSTAVSDISGIDTRVVAIENYLGLT